MEAYRRAFIATGSFEPVKHVMVRAPPADSRRIRCIATFHPIESLTSTSPTSNAVATASPQAGVFLMAFGMEHYMHHKYHAHAEAAAPAAAEAPAVEKPKPGGAGLPPAAAAALVEPLPANADELAEEIKSLRQEIATLRQGIRVAAEAGEAKKK